MLVSKGGAFSRHPDHERANLIYIERLSSAPCRIGLHALPGAETFYRDVIGMTDLREDTHHHGLQYFELSTAQAAKFFA